jgi:hypothetical protein
VQWSALACRGHRWIFNLITCYAGSAGRIRPIWDLEHSDQLTKNDFMRKAAKISLLVLGFVSLPLAKAVPTSLLQTLGLKEGQSYVSARAQLIGKRWKVDLTYAATRDAGKTPPYGFKEVICGNGWQAVCSARFLRNGQKIMLTLRPNKSLLVEGVWDD